MTTDEELVAAWRDGDTRSGGELFGRHFNSVRRFFRNKVPIAETADLVQHTFEACLHAQERYRGDGRFVAYLLKIARTQLHRWIRKRDPTRYAIEASSICELGISPSAVAAGLERDQFVLECLRQIPLHMQIILELHYWEGLDAADIALVMELAPGAVRTRLSRARDALRERIVAAQRCERPELAELATLDAEARIARDLLH